MHYHRLAVLGSTLEASEQFQVSLSLAQDASNQLSGKDLSRIGEVHDSLSEIHTSSGDLPPS
jgi:hypothetical protein